MKRKQKTILARLVGFTTDGTPTWTEYDMPVCLDLGIPESMPTNVGVRHFDFTVFGEARWATALTCCTSVDHCRPRVETGCVPGGVDHHVTLTVTDVENCPTATDPVTGMSRVVRMQFCDPNGPIGTIGDPCYIPDCLTGPTIASCTNCDDATKGKWNGSVTLRGGTIDFETCCFRVADLFDPTITYLYFRLLWKGICNTVEESGCVEVRAGCEDPINVNFGQIDIPNCCECLNTDTTATVNVTLQANCHGNVIARHVGFLPSGEPIWAERNCQAPHEPYVCAPTCGLTAIVSGCSGYDGTYALTYESGGPSWNFDGPPALHVECTCNGDGTATLCLTVQCGATNTGSACLVVAECDLEDLDVTFSVEMTDPSSGSCTGFCRYLYNTMTVAWSLAANDCSFAPGEGCDDCGEAPTSPPPDPENYTIVTFDEACTGAGVPCACCCGPITVRVMR